MKSALTLSLLALLAAPACADDAKPAAAPSESVVAAPAPVTAKPAPVLNFEVPVKDTQLDAMDKALERRMAQKRLPKSDSAIGLREPAKKKDAEAPADAPSGQY
jgi:hypothetical protein